MKVLLHEFDVPNAAFSADVLACLPPQGWAITEDLIGKSAHFTAHCAQNIKCIRTYITCIQLDT